MPASVYSALAHRLHGRSGETYPLHIGDTWLNPRWAAGWRICGSPITRGCTKDTRPDIAHIQEIDHEISPSILHTIKQFGIPIVQTLHDYKLLCPNTNFISHGEVCERCRRYRYYPAVLRRCKRNSFPASVLACLETYFQQLTGIYENNVDLFIVPSRFLACKLAEHGFHARMETLPNPVDVESFRPSYDTSDYFIFFGRLVSLKGVKTLFKAMRHVQTAFY